MPRSAVLQAPDQLGLPDRFDSLDLRAARTSRPALGPPCDTSDRPLTRTSCTLLRNLPTGCSMIVRLAAGSLREPMGVGRNASEELFRAAEVHRFAKPSDRHAEFSNYRESTHFSRVAAKG